MNNSIRHGTVLATLICAAVLAGGMSTPASARQPAGTLQDQRHENASDAKGEKDKGKKDKADKPSVRSQAGHPDNSPAAAQRNAANQQKGRVSEQRQDNRRDHAEELRLKQLRDARADRRQDDRQRISERDQRARIEQQRNWVQANVQHQQQARKLELQRAQQLKQANRNAQYRYQRAYYQRLNAQQTRLNNQRYDYNSNPYFSSPNIYRYSFGGRNYTTNQYGANLLRQAVNYGYQEGLRAGHADRSDRSNSDYRNSYAYQDASYGYDNYYVDRQEYIHFFREGFQRGYNDGYGSRRQYGSYSNNYLGGYDNNGTATILQAVLGTILNLQQMNP